MRDRGRLWEVDVLRTAAIVMMVVYHVVYDIRFLAPDVGPNPYQGGWRALQVACASTFLTLVGLSFWIRHARLRSRGVRAWERWRTGAPRGLQVAAGAAAVSLATFATLGDEGVRFGILHVIAVAHLLVLPVVVGLKLWNAALGVAAIGAGLALEGVGTSMSLLLVLGLDPGETGVDWVPLLPWIGMPLLGVAVGAFLYPDGRRRPLLRRLADEPPLADLAGAPGRRSLTIYLVHQPVLIALVAGVLTVSGTPPDPR